MRIAFAPTAHALYHVTCHRLTAGLRETLYRLGIYTLPVSILGRVHGPWTRLVRIPSFIMRATIGTNLDVDIAAVVNCNQTSLAVFALAIKAYCSIVSGICLLSK